MYTHTFPYIPQSCLGFSVGRSLSRGWSLGDIRASATEHDACVCVCIWACVRARGCAFLTHGFAHGRALALELAFPLGCTPSRRTRSNGLHALHGHACTEPRFDACMHVRCWERKPRARFAATSAVARHSASEPVRLAGNRPTNGRLSRATLRSITRIDFPHGIYNDGLPFDSRQLPTDDEDSFVQRNSRSRFLKLRERENELSVRCFARVSRKESRSNASREGYRVQNFSTKLNVVARNSIDIIRYNTHRYHRNNKRRVSYLKFYFENNLASRI